MLNNLADTHWRAKPVWLPQYEESAGDCQESSKYQEMGGNQARHPILILALVFWIIGFVCKLSELTGNKNWSQSPSDIVYYRAC